MSVSATMSRIAELTERREPFVHATVVRAQVPTSARAGDQAIVRTDGTIEGFVGGHCAAGSVRVAALDAIATGASVLLRVLPEGSDPFPDSPGASVVVNPCLSGGAMEIFLEPVLPAPVIRVAGESPVARAIGELGPPLGFEVVDAADADPGDGAVAAVVAMHGGDEPGAIRSALDAGVALIGVVASPRRGAALLDEMGLTEDERARVQTPAGLDIGAETAPEVALAILAGIVKSMRSGRLTPVSPTAPPTQPTSATPLQVVDPVCGMTVVVGPDTPHLQLDGEDFWFCCQGCRDRYATEHGVS